MYKIATHNSATGERAKNFLSWLLIPFCRTQSKTISEQYYNGCRNFDIRVKKAGDRYHCAHGAFVTKRTAWEILREIDEFPCKCHVSITYEGVCEDIGDFKNYITAVMIANTHTYWGDCCVKYADKKDIKPDYTCIMRHERGYQSGTQGFLPLDGHSWHTYLPIPWLWDRLYSRPHKFNEQTFTYVDFL